MITNRINIQGKLLRMMDTNKNNAMHSALHFMAKPANKQMAGDIRKLKKFLKLNIISN